MWFLISSEGTRIHLERDKHWMFGRKKGDILLENDDSVSRLHASITVTPNKPSKDRKSGSTCELQDLDSKYGTYVSSKGGEFVRKNSHILENGDKIRVGLQNHIFTIHCVPLITATSTISENEKEKLQSLLNEIDGVVSEEWTTSCTHLTVTCALLTEKVVWAITSCVPIVTIAYWEHMKKAIAAGTKIPDANNFVPPIGEGLINKDKVSLLPNGARKELFKDLVFIFFSAMQFKVYGKMVHLAGGKSALFEKKSLTFKDLCLPNVVAVQFPDDYASQATEAVLPKYEKIYELMRSRSLRIVPEREIPLAILHCSIKTYCNPRHKFKLRLETRTPDLGEVLVPDTQDIEQDGRVLPTVISDVRVKAGVSGKNNNRLVNVIIPETCDFLSGDDTITESGVGPEAAKDSQSVNKRHSDQARKAGDQNIRSNTKKKSHQPKKSPTPPKSCIKEKVKACDVSSGRVSITEFGIVPETVEESQPTIQRHCDHNPKVGDKLFRSNTEKRGQQPKDSQICAKSPIKGNIKEKIASLVNMGLEIKKQGIIIPETLDILNASTEPSRSPVATSPKGLPTLTPKKRPISEEHVETLAKNPERSPTLRVCNGLTPNRLKRNPVCSQASNKVVNWLAVMDNFTEDTSENQRVSPVRCESRNNENSHSQMDTTPTNRPSKKRSRTPSDVRNEGEYMPPTKRTLFLNKSNENETTLSPTNTVRNVISNSPPYLRQNPVNKPFKKAKILIPAHRISFKNMTT